MYSSFSQTGFGITRYFEIAVFEIMRVSFILYTVSDFDVDESLADFDFLPVTKAIITQKSPSSTYLNPDDLITCRSSMGFRSVTSSSIGEESEDDDFMGKRKRASKKPNLAYSGRNARKGEGQHSDVKVKGKGDGLDGESQFMDSIVEEVGEIVDKNTEDLGVVVDDDVESVDWEAKVAEVERQRGKLLPERTSIEPNLIKNGDTNEHTALEVCLQQKSFENNIVREGSPHSSHSRRTSVSSDSSRHSRKETRGMSIVSMQEYNVSRPSSTQGSRTFTPLSRHSPKRSTPSDKQSTSNLLKSDSGSASVTGSELKNKDSNINDEITEIQDNAIYENQEILDELNEREREFVTEGQIHVDISFGIDDDYNVKIEKNATEEIDFPDNAGFDEAVDTQVELDGFLVNPADQKVYVSESEGENDWAGRETVEDKHEENEADKQTLDEEEKPKSPDDSLKLVSENNDKEDIDSGEAEMNIEVEIKIPEDAQSEVIETEATVEDVGEPKTETVDIKIAEEPEKTLDEIKVVEQENLDGKGLCTYCFVEGLILW